ncbi:MAG: hypothetical protein LBU60_05325 [Clostridiales bacterium]|jgi:hypothetical protein|nr:hypothetical protein [Clostridiales bacterium]
MNKRFNARVTWLTSEQGGRQTLPFGDKYAPIIRIISPYVEPLPLDNKDGPWSLFVHNKQTKSKNETIADVWYLSKEAPDNLFIGVEFELYEGAKLVAKGHII